MKHRIIEGNEVLDTIRNNFDNIHKVYICSPFIKEDALKEVFEIFKDKRTLTINIITKFDLLDIVLGVSDAEAFELAFSKNTYKNWQVNIFILNNLHAKAILLGQQTAILGSANITNGGFNRNEELGIAIYEGDSKIETIKKKLDKYISNGYELTQEQFEWNKTKQLPRFEAKVKAIRQVMNIIKYERNVGLQSFAVRKDDKRLNYFEGLLSFLTFLQTNKPTKKNALKYLTKNAINQGEGISEHRLTFLFNLGLAYEKEDKVILSGLGTEFLAKIPTEQKEMLYNRLRGFFPEFGKLEVYLSQNEYISPEKLEQDTHMEGKKHYWATRLRWLESVGKVSSLRIDNVKNYKKI